MVQRTDCGIQGTQRILDKIAQDRIAQDGTVVVGWSDWIEDLRRDFFELRALRGQKDHNNLLPPVKSRGITCVSRRGMTLMAAFIIVTHEKCCFVAHF